jgi:predicted P-loop ATPase
MPGHISEHAFTLVKNYGFHLVPCRANSKVPIPENWQNKAISDPNVARKTWSGEEGEKLNMGVNLGLSRLASLDIDDPFAAEMIFKEFGVDIEEYRKHSPVVQGTPGCYRIMFRLPEGVELGKHVIRWPKKEEPSTWETVFELRSGPSQDVLPPSMHPDGHAYIWLTKPHGTIPELPEEMIVWWRQWEVFKKQAVALCPWLPEQAPERPRNYAPKPRTGDSVIEAWNQAHPLRSMLEAKNYTKVGNRYLSPHSTTKLPGVKMFDNDSCWMHHGSDPLCSNDDNQPRDSFDFFRVYDHRGDYHEAIKAAAKILGMDYKTRATVYHDAKPATLEVLAPDEYGSPMHLYQAMGMRLDGNDKPILNIDNIIRVIKHAPDIQNALWFDTFLERTMTTFGQPEGTVVEWSDQMDILLTAWMQEKLHLNKVSLTTVQAAVQAVAYTNKKNECLEWLESLEWDGEERLPQFLYHAFGTPDDAYHAAVGRCWFVSMAARVLIPGSKVDTMPVFEGKQGLRKSSALGVIGGKWFAECHENILSKDFYGVLQGKMLVEIAEMHAFSKADVNRIKGIISCREDRYREAYGRRASDHPRQSVFAGTTNADDWNRDETGARRFWPVACTAIDLQYIHDHRDQLFAEAVARKRRGESWWDVPVEDAEKHQDARRPEDSWEDVIRHRITGREWVRIEELLTYTLDIPLGRQTNADQNRVAKVLRLLKWNTKLIRIDGIVTRVWVPMSNSK